MLNPVLRREAQTSLRSWKVFAVITIYVTIVAGAAAIYIYSSLNNSMYWGFDPQNIVTMYTMLCSFQFGLILITVPALTAGSISGERERQTLDLLLTTKMSSFSIVLGKLVSSLAVVVLLILSTIPVFSIIFYFGGLSLLSLFGMTFFLLIVTCMVGSISIFFSTVFKKTVISMVLVYLIIGMLCGGTVIGYFLYTEMLWSYYDILPGFFAKMAFLGGNPAIGFLSVIEKQTGDTLVTELFNMYQYYTDTATASPTPEYQYYMMDHFWMVNGVINLVIMFLFLFLASKMLHRIKRK